MATPSTTPSEAPERPPLPTQSGTTTTEVDVHATPKPGTAKLVVPPNPVYEEIGTAAVEQLVAAQEDDILTPDRPTATDQLHQVTASPAAPLTTENPDDIVVAATDTIAPDEALIMTDSISQATSSLDTSLDVTPSPNSSYFSNLAVGGREAPVINKYKQGKSATQAQIAQIKERMTVNQIHIRLLESSNVEPYSDAVKADHEFLTNNNKRLEEDLKKIEAALAEMDVVSRLYEMKLSVPKDRDHTEQDKAEAVIDYEHLTSMVADFRQGPHFDFEIAWKKFIEYGRTQHYSHANYLTALSHLLQGDMYRVFYDIKAKPFADIAKILFEQFSDARTVQDDLNTLKRFTRKPKEKLKVCMSRLSLLLDRISILDPEQERVGRKRQRQERHLLQLCSPVAAKRIEQAKREAAPEGYYVSYEGMLDLAVMTEKALDYSHGDSKMSPKKDQDFPTHSIAYMAQAQPSNCCTAMVPYSNTPAKPGQTYQMYPAIRPESRQKNQNKSVSFKDDRNRRREMNKTRGKDARDRSLDNRRGVMDVAGTEEPMPPKRAGSSQPAATSTYSQARTPPPPRPTSDGGRSSRPAPYPPLTRTDSSTILPPGVARRSDSPAYQQRGRSPSPRPHYAEPTYSRSAARSPSPRYRSPSPGYASSSHYAREEPARRPRPTQYSERDQYSRRAESPRPVSPNALVPYTGRDDISYATGYEAPNRDSQSYPPSTRQYHRDRMGQGNRPLNTCFPANVSAHTTQQFLLHPGSQRYDHYAQQADSMRTTAENQAPFCIKCDNNTPHMSDECFIWKWGRQFARRSSRPQSRGTGLRGRGGTPMMGTRMDNRQRRDFR